MQPMKINISLSDKKDEIFIGKIDVTMDELIKHKNQKLTLVLNRLTDYMLKNAKQDDVIDKYMRNLDYAKYITDDGLAINLLEE
jgi:hypothetical protein